MRKLYAPHPILAIFRPYAPAPPTFACLSQLTFRANAIGRRMIELRPADAAVGARSRSLYAIWKECAGTRLAPRRAEITLAKVGALMPWLWMLDVVDGGFRFRLAGQEVNQFLGGPFTGRLLSELPAGDFTHHLEAALMQSLNDKRPLALGPLPSGYAGKDHWEIELAILPLSEDGEAINCLMGALELWPLGNS